MYALMYVCALMYVLTNVKSDCPCSSIYIYTYIIICIYVYIYIHNNVWIRGMEQRYGTDPSNRYGTEVWNGGMERVWSRTLFRTL